MEAVGGVTPVFVSSQPTQDDGEPALSTYDALNNEIEIDADYESTIQKQLFFHETIHRCFQAASGVALSEMFGTSSIDLRHKREELATSHLETHLFDVLMRNGWLHIPNAPRTNVRNCGKVRECRAKTSKTRAGRKRKTKR